MLKTILIEGIKNIDKNKFLTYLTVFLFALIFLLQGYTLSYYTVSLNRNKVAENEDFSSYELYRFIPESPLVDIYFEENFKDEIHRAIYDLRETFNQIEHLKFVSEYSNTVGVYDFKGDPKVFTDSYISSTTSDSETTHVFAFIVGPNFHDVESYTVVKGTDFNDENLVYKRGEPRPVLLGYKYIGVYDIGDIITIADNSLFFGGLVSQFKVIGFLDEDTTVISNSGTKIYDLDNYMILPAVTLPWDEYVELSEEFSSSVFRKYTVHNVSYHFTLFESKLYIESEYEDEVLAKIQDAINKCSGVSQFVRLHNSGQASLKRASRTEALTSFFAEITAVMIFFSTITVLISIRNRVANNVKDYAIHIAVGATRGSTIGFIIAEMSIILACSIILGIIATKWLMYYINMPFYFWKFLGVYVLTSVIILVLSAIVARLAIRKYDICTLIK